MRIHYRSIRRKICVCILVFMGVPVIITTLLSNSMTVGSLIEQKRVEDLDTIRQLQVSINQMLETQENYSKLLAGSESVKQFFREKVAPLGLERKRYQELDSREATQGFTQLLPSVLGVSLLDSQGFLIGEHAFDADRLNWFFNPFQIAKLSELRPIWTEPFYVEPTGRPAVLASAVVAPIKSEADQLVGYVALHLPMEYVGRFVNHLSNQVYLVDKQDYVIASKEMFAYYESLYQHTKINYQHLREDASIVATQKGEKVVLTSKVFPEKEWKILVVSGYDNIVTKKNQSRLINFAVLSACCVLFSLLCAVIVSKVVTRPLVNLQNTMKKVMTRDLSARETPRSDDEIGELTTTFNTMLDTIEDLMHQVYEQQANRRRLQLSLLQAQVKPHFLYNVLEMVCCFIRDGMRKEALASVTNLAQFYRVSLSDGSEIISVEREVHLTENYLNLQRLRYVEFMDFTMTVHPSLYAYQIPKLALQPLVENAIYHGLKGRLKKGLICVAGYLQEGRVVFEVYDDGVGIKPKQLEVLRKSIATERKGTDFGLASVIQRLNIFYDGEAQMTLESEADKFTNVTLSFPAREILPEHL